MINKIVLDTLKRISKGKSSNFPQEDEQHLAEALNLNTFNVINCIGKLLSCVEELVMENNSLQMGKNIQNKRIIQLEKEITTLKGEINKRDKIMSTYNGTYLQRSKVKNGLKISKKSNVTKEAIQELQEQGLTTDQIAEKLECSTTTIWRRLNKKSE